MALTHAQMDRIINDHFGFEARDDVDGVVGSLAEPAEHEVVPSPVGKLTDRGEIRSFYQRLFQDLRGEKVTPIRRLYGENFLVDETLWQGQITDGRQFLMDGKHGPVSFRLLHVFELEGEKIKNEAVWCDLAAIQRQLGGVPA
jgi:hypothetical protein